MEEKGMLINSMQKLIKHISSSQKNQEQIFKSLSKNDLKKIVSNLDDQNTQLRKVSFKLLTELLYNNYGLKQKFCELMAIPVIPGKIVVNSKLIFSLRNQLIPNFFKIIKSSALEKAESGYSKNKNGQQMPLFWFIKIQDRNLKIQNVQRDINDKKPIQYDIDPAKCIFGITLEKNIQIPQSNGKKVSVRTQKPTTQQQQNQPIEAKFQAVNIKPSSANGRNLNHLNERKSNPIQNSLLINTKPYISKMNDSLQVRAKTYEAQNNQYLYEDCCNAVSVNNQLKQGSSTNSDYCYTPSISNKKSPNRYNKISTTVGNQVASIQNSFDLTKAPQRFSTDFDPDKRNSNTSKISNLSNMSNSIKIGGLRVVSGAAKSKEVSNKHDYAKPKVTNISFSSKTNASNVKNDNRLESPVNRVNVNSIKNRMSIGTGISRPYTRQSTQPQSHNMSLSFQEAKKPHITLGRGNQSTKNQQKINQKYIPSGKLYDSYKNQEYSRIKNQ